MKIKEVAALCKKRKTVYVYDDAIHDIQWIGDGSAAYPFFKMPKMNKQNIFTLFEVTEKKENEFNFIECEMPEDLFNDIYENEKLIERGQLELILHGLDLRPLMTTKGITFINEKYMKPLSDIIIVELFERTLPSGEVWIAVKSGFLLLGIISPYIINDKEIIKEIKALGEQYINYVIEE